MLEDPKGPVNRAYNVYYNKEHGRVQIVYQELAAPSHHFKFVETLDHNPAESHQMLRNRAIAAVARFDPTLDINEVADVKFIDEQPYGNVDTGKEDKHDEPDEPEDPPKKDKKARKAKTKE